ncbi:MAG: ATP-binding protein [Verrucomicrobiota bacterium]
MPAGGTLTLEALVVKVDKRKARETEDVKPGVYVRFGVEDTGIGIPADHLEKIFEPFFTTKGVGQGTGLGLSAVFGIVRSHGGFIEVHSEIGRGSRFHIHLPALAARPKADDPAGRSAVVEGRGRGILVCDDEEPIRFISGAVLGKHGFKVFTAANGEEARRLHEQHRDEIHLALLDIMLPAETGDRIAVSLRKASPGLPILFSTGMIGDAAAEKILHEQLRLPDTALLAKPYDELTLVNNIARLLDHPERTRPV